MKKKLTVNSIATSNLRARKGQYISLVLSIILAMTFSSGILFFISSYYATAKQDFCNKLGNQELIIYSTEEEVEKAENKVLNAYDYTCGTATVVGQVVTDDISFVAGYFDDNAKSISNIQFVSGTYPKSTDEVAMEENTLISLGYDESYLNKEVELTLNIQNGNEVLDKTVTKKYTLVGIASNKASNTILYCDDLPLTSIFLSTDTLIEAGGKEQIYKYYIFSNVSFEEMYSESGISESLSDISDVKKQTFNSSNNWIFSNDGNDESFVFASIFAGILLFASCIAIVNSFLNHINNRKKQIGMLRTVGATKRQIINIYGREAFLITLISCPISIALSYFATKLLLPLIYDEAVISLEISTLALCAVVSIVCVMLTSLIPLIKASSLSPVQSIRDIEANRKIKAKHIKTQKEYNVPSLLAKRRLIIGGKKRAIISVLIVITVIISATGFTFSYTMIDEASNIIDPVDYYFYLSYINNAMFIGATESVSEGDINEVKSSPYVENVYATGYNGKIIIESDEENEYLEATSYESIYDYNNETQEQEINSVYSSVKSVYSLKNPYVATIIVINSDEYDDVQENILKNSDMSKSSFFAGNEVIVLAPDTAYVQKSTDNYGDVYISSSYKLQEDDEYSTYELLTQQDCNLSVGDELSLKAIYSGSVSPDEFYDGDASFIEENTQLISKDVKIGAIASLSEGDVSGLYSIGSDGEIVILVPSTMFSNQGIELGYTSFDVYLNRDCTDEIDNYMMTLLENIGRNKSSDVRSVYQATQDNDSYYRNIVLIAVGIIILLITICASLINNSLGAQIRNSKKKIGTLSAVGANVNVITSSYIKQLLSIFTVSYGIGFGIVIVFTVVDFVVYKLGYASQLIPVQFIPTVIVCLILFVICSINLWIKIKKALKNSVIENIRESE